MKKNLTLHLLYGSALAVLAMGLLFALHSIMRILSEQKISVQEHHLELLRSQVARQDLAVIRDSVAAKFQVVSDSLCMMYNERKKLHIILKAREHHFSVLQEIWRDSLALFHTRKTEYTERIATLEQQILQTTAQTPLVTLRFRSAKDNEKVTYIGHAVNNIASGFGVGLWESGSVYEGEWQENKRHGKGVHQWKDGVRYEGEFAQDYRSGIGTYFWKNGDRYYGQWQGGKRNGFGTVYDKHGTVKVYGRWEDDRLIERLEREPNIP